VRGPNQEGPGTGFETYALKQFHFHTPSEEKTNGKRYAISVHLVHADPDDNLAAVAALLQKGEENPLVLRLWNNLPMQKGKEEILDNVQIDASGLLPADHDYYDFPGTLTTPPCSENVTWFVLKQPATVSEGEIE